MRRGRVECESSRAVFTWPCQIDTINPALKIYSDTHLQQVQTPCCDSPCNSANILDIKSSQYDSATWASFIFPFTRLGYKAKKKQNINWQSDHSDTCQSKGRPLLSHKHSDSSFHVTKFCWVTPYFACGDAIVVLYCIYIHCPWCMHMCFWVVLNEIRVQLML